MVKASGDALERAVACRLYRTPDTTRLPADFRLVDRDRGTANFTYADNVLDIAWGALSWALSRCRWQRHHLARRRSGPCRRALRLPQRVGFGTLPSEYVATPDPTGLWSPRWRATRVG